MTPDPWQTTYLRSTSKRELLKCCRGAGKTRIVAARTLARMLTRRNYRSLFFSPTQRQADEVLAYTKEMYEMLGKPWGTLRDRERSLHLSNGSRVDSLPDNQKGVRGLHVDEVVLDEASQISDGLYYSVRPMVMRRKGSIVGLSTPFGKRGWYWEAWESNQWQCTVVTASDSGRFTEEDLAKERAALGERWFRQEFMCSFEDVVGALFSGEEIDAMFDVPYLEPLWSNDE